jgi:signal transduction histidine kinase
MNEEIQKRIFDPFFSTKFLGRGLSLAAAQGFIESAGGTIHVESSPGQGSRFRIVLPEKPVAVKSNRTMAR